MLRSAAAGRFTLIFVEGVAEELERKLTERPDLASKIPRASAATLIESLRSVGEVVPRLSGPYPAICRDRNDDFLLAHAVFSRADWLVTYDRDLLDLDRIGDLTITDPPGFLTALRGAGLL